LHPSSRGVRIAFDGPQRRVIDGPFAETRELVAGFWLWQVRSLDEAIEWAKRCPNPMPGPSELEIRPIFEAEDFGAEFTPELRAQEDRLRERLGNWSHDQQGADAMKLTPCLMFFHGSCRGAFEFYAGALRG